MHRYMHTFYIAVWICCTKCKYMSAYRMCPGLHYVNPFPSYEVPPGRRKESAIQHMALTIGVPKVPQA